MSPFSAWTQNRAPVSRTRRMMRNRLESVCHQRRALVGHEALEAANAVPHDVVDLVERVAAQIGQHHVEAVSR